MKFRWGMLQLAGWDGKGNFLDPMCGSGTLLIEAAMLAMDLPAQILERNSHSKKWKIMMRNYLQKSKNLELIGLKIYRKNCRLRH